MNTKTHHYQILMGLIALLILGGCANNSLTGDTYSREDARKVQTVEFGEVMSVRPVIIEGDREGIVGNLGGTLIGGIAGSAVGDGRGRAISTVIGSAIGGIAGQAAEEKATRKQGQEIQIRKDNGTVISVVQEVKDQQFFQAGDRVRLLKVNGLTRVSE